jgi:hypothetical protein
LYEKIISYSRGIVMATPFENFDFSDFWAYPADEDKFCGKMPVSDELIEQAEEEFGYKLPASYISFLKQRNGGIPKKLVYYG